MDLWLPPKPAIIIPAPKELQPPALGLTLMASTWALRAKRQQTAAAAPIFVAAGAKQELGGTGTLNIPYYAGIAANHVAVIFAIVNTPAADISGFTAFAAAGTIGLSGVDVRSYWRRLTGGESGTVSLATSSDGGGAIMFGFSGCITTGTPYEDFGQVVSDQDGSVTSASTTTTGPGRLGVRIYGHSGSTSTPPGSWVERHDAAATTSFVSTAMNTLEIPSATTEAATSINAGSVFIRATHSFALIPA